MKKSALLSRLQISLDNLNSISEKEGLTAFYNFTEDLSTFLSKNNHAPIYIPGLWVFQSERIIMPLFLKEALADLEIKLPVHLQEKSDQTYEALFRKWYMVDVLTESNHAKFTPQKNGQIVNLLKKIQIMEQKSVWILEDIYAYVLKSAV